jgi:hypothetical protein
MIGKFGKSFSGGAETLWVGSRVYNLVKINNQNKIHLIYAVTTASFSARQWGAGYVFQVRN